MLTIEVEGAKQLRSALKGVDLHRELGPAHKRVADSIAQRARGRAPRRHMKSAIRAAGTRTKAAVRVTPGRRRDAIAVVVGQKQRSGWYGWRRYRQSQARQFRPWLGQGWEPEDLYFIGPAFRQDDRTLQLYLDELDRILRKAFPN